MALTHDSALSEVNDWQTANYYYLIGRIEKLKQRIQSTQNDSEGGFSGIELSQEREQTELLLNLDRLCHYFNLSNFECDLLLLAAGFEFVPDLPQVCALALGREPYPLTLGLVTSLFSQVDWNALSIQGPLRQWQLIEVGEGRSWQMRPLRLPEAVLNYLLGIYTCDERLAALLKPVTSYPRKMAHSQVFIETIVHSWIQGNNQQTVLHLIGNDIDSQCDLIQKASTLLEYPVFKLNMHAFPDEGQELYTLLRLLVREVTLHPNLIFLLEYDALPIEKRRVLATVVNYVPAHWVLLGQEVLTGISYPVTYLQMPFLTTVEQLQLWQQILGTAVTIEEEQLASLVAQFNLNATQINHFAHTWLKDPTTKTTADVQGLWQHCRRYLRQKTHSLVQVIDPKAGWQDLSLPIAQTQILHALIAQVKQRAQVYQQWGFANKTSRGLGICALFAGPSGTGKTLAAEVIAHQLGLDLHHIDLSAVVSKYIGETEKHLNAIFTGAESCGAVLLFDEADALFGKRSEVKDSHDRYANLEVSYLLQRMEAYSGLSILTTNLKSALDEAFLRRIRFIVQFPFPDHSQRMQIWQRAFPAQTPTQGLDIQKLACLNLAGGHIRNIALNAAFLAAKDQRPVTMSYLYQAAQSEYLKLEKTLTKNEVRDWL